MKNSLLLQQENLGLVAWSPFQEDPFLLARGSLLDEPENSSKNEEIEILRIDPLHISDKNPLVPLGSLETGVTLNYLDWSRGFLEDSPKGIISGAFRDGSLVLLDAQKLLESGQKTDNAVLEDDEESEDPSLLSSFTLYDSQEFYCMEYNAFKPHLLATGGSDIYIVNFEQSLDEPEVFSPYPPDSNLLKGSKVTSICWNKNKGVQHILAAACDDGRISIFDLKTKKSIFSLSDQKEHLRGRNVSIQWNTSIATQLGIAFDDEASGVQIWDLRNPKSPVKILDRDVVTKVHSLDWQSRDRMLLCDMDGVVRSYNSSSDTYSELHRPEPPVVAPVETNALDVFNNLAGQDAPDSLETRWLYAKSIPGIKDAFYSVNDRGNLIAKFDDRKEVSALASKFLDCDLASGWKRGITFGSSSVVLPSDLGFKGQMGNADYRNASGVEVVQLEPNSDLEALELDEEETQLMDRIRSSARDWEAYIRDQTEGGKKALKERLRKKGLDSVMLDLIGLVGSRWKEKLPVFGMDREKTVSNTEKVTGYKYSKASEEEGDTAKDPGQANANTGPNEGICEFADISENEAEDFFTQLAKKNEKPESKAEKSVFSERNISSKGLYETVNEMDMEREVVMRNRDWGKGLEQLIKQNILLDNFEGAIDCAIKANRYFEGFLIAFSHPQNSQALLQKTLDKVSQRHSEDFIHGFLKPLFKKDYAGIIERYPLEDWQEALAYIVHNLEDSQSQSDCLQLLRNRIEESVDQSNHELGARSERNTHRRETVSNKVTLPSETLLYLDLFQNDINNTVKHMMDQLETLSSDNARQLVNVVEYLLFMRTSQTFALDHEKLKALLLELSNLICLAGHPLMAFYVLESLGEFSDYYVQKAKYNIWKKHSAEFSKYFTEPCNPTPIVYFPRQSILRQAPVSTQKTQPKSQYKKSNPSRPGKPNIFSRNQKTTAQPFARNPTPAFGNNPPFPVKTNPPVQPPAKNVMRKKAKPPGPPGIRPNMPAPAPTPFNKPFGNPGTKVSPPPPTKPVASIKKNKPGPPLPPKTGLIPKPSMGLSKPMPPPSKPTPGIVRPPPGSSTLHKKTVPTKPNLMKPPPPKKPAPPVNRPAPPMNRPAPPVNRPAPPVNRPAPPINRPAPPINRPTPGVHGKHIEQFFCYFYIENIPDFHKN